VSNIDGKFNIFVFTVIKKMADNLDQPMCSISLTENKSNVFWCSYLSQHRPKQKSLYQDYDQLIERKDLPSLPLSMKLRGGEEGVSFTPLQSTGNVPFSIQPSGKVHQSNKSERSRPVAIEPQK
jgi:hypothetical protein